MLNADDFKPAPVGGVSIAQHLSLNASKRIERDEFFKELKREWALLWMERFDDKFRAEGVAVRDYPLLFMDKGFVIFATRDAKAPNFWEIVENWTLNGKVYAPDPSLGGWGKFVRTFLNRQKHKRTENYEREADKVKQQRKKGGRGWLHIE